MGNIPKYIYDSLKRKGNEKVTQKVDELIIPLEKEFSKKATKLFIKHKKGFLKFVEDELCIDPSISSHYNSWASCYNPSVYIGANSMTSLEHYEPFRTEFNILKKEYERKVDNIISRVKDKFDEWLLDIWQSGSSDVNISLPDLDVDVSDIIGE